MKTGIHALSNQSYHSGTGLSSSGIKQILRSPAHFKEYCTNKPEPTTEMVRGTLVHALILEPEKFENDFVVGDVSKRYGKEYERIVEENPGKTFVTKAEYEEASAIKDAFVEQGRNVPGLSALLDGVRETSMYWTDPATGILCKCRPDIITKTGVIVDVKTTFNAGFDAFQKQMVDLNYFVSAAFYLRGVQAVCEGGDGPLPLIPVIPTSFTIIAIETKAPYPIALYKFSSKSLEIGNQLVDRALETYAEAIATDEWSGYPKEIVELDLPQWAYYKLNRK